MAASFSAPGSGGAAPKPKIGKAAEQEKIAVATARGETLFEIGQKLLDKPTVPNLKTKLHSARRVFENAAEAFLVAGKWRSAARSYAMCAELEKKAGFEKEAATYFVDAGEYAEKVDHELALLYYAQGVSCLVSQGRFVAAAVIQRRIAEVCTEDSAHNESGRAYGYSADLYLGCDELQQAALMYYASGKQYCLAKQYLDGRQAFEKCAAVADDDNMMRYKVPSIMLDACLAMIATGDIPGTEDYVVELSKQNYLFATGKEAKFIFDIVDNAKTVNLDNLMDHIWNYDYVEELKPHQLEILLRVYKMYVAELDEIETTRREAEDVARSAGRKKLSIKETLKKKVKGSEAEEGAVGGAGKGGAAAGTAT